ncbi:MAG: lipoprotein-releasing ABC transporter permease subunit [Steroidobacteraceae bacterium]
MFHPLPVYIGLRYVRTRRRGFFVSFISWVSMLGVGLGVAALIVILSVMNGFEAELRGRLLNLSSHATLSGSPEQLRDWRSLADRARQTPGVLGVAPYIEMQSMVGRGGTLTGAKLRGVLPDEEPQVSDIDAHMVTGKLATLTEGSQYVLLGAGLAWQLQAQVGDEINVLIPETVAGTTELRSRLQSFKISGVFEFGAQEDNSLALINMADAAALASTEGAPTGLRLKFQDIFTAPAGVKEINQQLGGELTTSDWTQENASYFRAVSIEKTMMAVMLMLIVAIAAFNIVAALVMVVNEKRTDIAILRTIGLSPKQVIAVFITQGLLIGWGGILGGLIMGLGLAFNVGSIVPWIERSFGIQFFDPTLYYITQIPSEIHGWQVFWVAVIALLLTALATIYPARRGARVEPAEALRYE